MSLPTRGVCDKRPRVEGIPKFMIVDEIPLKLWQWWRNMEGYDQRQVKVHLGHLVHMMEIKPRRDVFEALVQVWNHKNNVFRSSDCEMTPTLEEIAGFMGMGSKLQGSDLRNKRPIVPKPVDGTKFLNYLKINQMKEASLESGWVSLEFLYERYGQEEGFEKYLGQLNIKGEIETWKIHRRFAFMVAFLGCIVFPERDKQIDIRLAGVVQSLTTINNPTLILMILGDIFRALTKCKEGAIYFERCNILLQIWLLEHFYRHHFAPKFNADWVNYMTEHEERVEKCDLPNGIKAWEEKLSKLTADKIIWNYHWFPAHEVICMSSHHPFLVQIGLRGVQPYAPLRVMRQLGRLQEIPREENMSIFMYDTPPGFLFDSDGILKIWYGGIISELREMVEDRDRGRVVPGYLSWLHKPSLSEKGPEGSRKRKLDRESEVRARVWQARLEVEHEFRARLNEQQALYEARIMQTRLDVEKNYQPTLHALDKELTNAREYLAQMEAEVDARVKTARKTAMRKHRSTIQTLYEDLGIVTQAVDQLQRKLDEKGDLFDAEKACFEDEKAQFLTLQTRQQAEFDRERAQFGVERNQLMNDRARIRNQLELALHREAGIREIATTRQQQVRDLEQNYQDVREHVYHLAVHVAQSCLDCQGMGYEQFAREVPTFARHFKAELKQIYRMLRGQPGPEAP